MKTPIAMNEDGTLLDVEGRQIAAIMPGSMRAVGHEIVALVNAQSHVPTFVAALEQIFSNEPDEKPTEEDYDDTETAHGNGMDVANWEAGQIARGALFAAGLVAEPPLAAQEAAARAAWLAVGNRIDEGEEAKAGCWSFYVVDEPTDGDHHDPRAIQRDGEWRVYFEDAISACAECGVLWTWDPYERAAVALGWGHDDDANEYRLNDTGEGYDAIFHNASWKELCEFHGIAPLDETWTIWKGGENPPDLSGGIEARYRDGTISVFDDVMEPFWHHDGGHDDIVAYRPYREGAVR